MLLSRNAILKHHRRGSIIIDPFDDRKLNTTSYDVSLGDWFWREGYPNGAAIHNLYDEASAARVWRGPFRAEKAGGIAERMELKLTNIAPDDLIVLLAPGETILAHTDEFIGGRERIVAKLYARSSISRNSIEIAKGAGWGDVGYFNRWTISISNCSRSFTIPLVAGRRIAQMVFYEVEPLKGVDYAGEGGKYQASKKLKKLKEEWDPQMMLPQMYKDWEVRHTS